MPPPAPTPSAPPVKLDYLAGVLSYLVPGLGQIVRGRVLKGALFLVALYCLFFYGMFLGNYQNVYLPDYDKETSKQGGLRRLASNIYTRFQFVGQAPIGVVAWPAIYQYAVFDKKDDAKSGDPLSANGWMRAPTLDRLNDLQRDSDKTWDLGWVYTLIAGVLNVLVIYDALAGPAFRTNRSATPAEPKA